MNATDPFASRGIRYASSSAVRASAASVHRVLSGATLTGGITCQTKAPAIREPRQMIWVYVLVCMEDKDRSPFCRYNDMLSTRREIRRIGMRQDSIGTAFASPP